MTSRIFAVTVILQQEFPRHVNAQKKKERKKKRTQERKGKQDMSRIEAK
jgi:hypothetical protein